MLMPKVYKKQDESSDLRPRPGNLQNVLVLSWRESGLQVGNVVLPAKNPSSSHPLLYASTSGYSKVVYHLILLPVPPLSSPI